MSARIPFGYRIRNGKAEPDPVEASQLQQFFRLYLQGKPASVASREAGIPRTSACCRKMLSNPVYCGTDYYPRLISPAQMDAVAIKRQEKLIIKKHAGRKPCFPLPVQTQFCFSASPSEPADDPCEQASNLYNRILLKD